MLASGSSDGTITLWDLSKNTNEHTFSDQPSGMKFLETYEKSCKSILVIGFDYYEIKLIELDDYNLTNLPVIRFVHYTYIIDKVNHILQVDVVPV